MAHHDDRDIPEKTGEWHPVATFVVEYQHRVPQNEATEGRLRHRTIAHCLEAGDTSTWEGLAGESLADWMLLRAVEAATGSYRQEMDAADSEVVAIPPRISLDEVTVSGGDALQASSTDGRTFQGYVSHRDRLSFAVAVGIGSESENRNAGCCRVDFSAYRLADGKRFFLGTTETGSTGKGRVRVSIDDITLEPGVYTVRVTAVLENGRPRLSYSDISLLVVT